MASAGRVCPRSTRPSPGVVLTSRLVIAGIADHLAAGQRRITAVTAEPAQSTGQRAHDSLTSSTVARYLDALDHLGEQPADSQHARRVSCAA
jgi:hypothetical protein